MKNHIYLNISHIDDIDSLNRDESFLKAPFYDVLSKQNILQNEYCKIETNSNVLHLLLGNISTDNCPWCGEVSKLVRKRALTFNTFDVLTSKVRLYFECPNCLSRGPGLLFNKQIEDDEELFQWVVERAKAAYSSRIPWDQFVNEKKFKG